MIKVVIIDDETPAIEELEYLLKSYQEIEIVGLYDDPIKALQVIEIQAPDLVFLDIDMPLMNGMEVALKIQEMNAGIEIVFVTAYNEFALRAFELHALDYILKPIIEERFVGMMKNVIDRCRLRKLAKAYPVTFRIRCFGKFEVMKKGTLTEIIKWRTHKAKEIFAYLIHRYGKRISKQELTRVMFHGMNEKSALNNIYTNIYYIRKVLEEFGIDRSGVLLKDNYTLEVSDGICDYVDFEKFINVNTVISNANVQVIEKITEIYQGAYLEEEDYPWAVESQAYLELKHEELFVKLADYFIENDQPQKAEKYLKKLLERDAICEEANHCLLDLLYKEGNREMYIKHYQEYTKILDSELSIQPHAKYRKIYEQYCCNEE